MQSGFVFKLIIRNSLLANLFICSGFICSAEINKLPEPLTLEYALELSKNINPDIAFKLAEKNQIESDKSLANAKNGFNVILQAEVKWYERSNPFVTSNLDEQKLSLQITKPIYDFGKNQYQLETSDHLLDGNSFEYQNTIYNRQVLIMEAYFSVLISDLIFHRSNESMATSFISWDRASQRQKLGTTSELEVEKKHSEYQRIRRERFESENNQRKTRNFLSVLMFSNGQLPTTLATPGVSKRIDQYPEIDQLSKKAFSNNLELKALRKKIDSVKSQINYLKTGNKPQVNITGEAIAYANEAQINDFSRDNWSIGFEVGMPIYDSGEIDSKIAKERAEVYRLETLLGQKKLLIRHELLTLKLRLDTLRFERDEANAFNDYSELFLDEKRALYEMEVESTLGTAMIQISDAQLGVANSIYETLLTWAKIDVLVGEEPAVNLFKK